MTIFIIIHNNEERLEQVFAPKLIRKDVPSARNLISFYLVSMRFIFVSIDLVLIQLNLNFRGDCWN